MKFVVDAQLPPRLAKWLKARGHDADHVEEIGLGEAPDRWIAAHAERCGAILVSKDEDSVVPRKPDRFAFLWLRIGNATNRVLIAWLEPRWPEIERLLSTGERLIERD